MSEYLGSTDVSLEFKYPINIEYLVVAGGGGGGIGNSKLSAGAGGGAGGWQSGSATLSSAFQSLPVIVGTGGQGASYNGAGRDSANGTNSSFNSLESIGGGRGGCLGTPVQETGGTGGSGGGSITGRSGGLGTAGQGFDGAAGYYLNDSTNGWWGGAGGGAASAPTNSPFRTGGDGKIWLNGNYYAAGAGGANGYGGIGDGTPGSGGAGVYVTSTEEGLTGYNGTVIIRYSGTQRAIGGTITQSGGYTYHTFTSSGNFTI